MLILGWYLINLPDTALRVMNGLLSAHGHPWSGLEHEKNCKCPHVPQARHPRTFQFKLLGSDRGYSTRRQSA